MARAKSSVGNKAPSRLGRCALLALLATWTADRALPQRGTAQANAGPVRHSSQAADCKRVRTCLAATLPAAFNVRNAEPLLRRAGACLGDSKAAQWAARDCLPARVRTQSNGRPLELRLTCADQCPTYARLFFSYPGVSESECRCLGEPVFMPASATYVGCQPVSTSASYRPSGVVPFGLQGGLRIGKPAFWHARLGFAEELVLLSLEGTPVEDKLTRLKQLANQYRKRAPKWITTGSLSHRTERRFRTAKGTSWLAHVDATGSLATWLNDVERSCPVSAQTPAALVTTVSLSSSESMRVVRYAADCEHRSAHELAALESQIIQLPELATCTSPPHAERGPACIDALATARHLAFQHQDRELRYLDEPLVGALCMLVEGVLQTRVEQLSDL